MSGACAWSLDGSTWTELPVGPQFDLVPGAERGGIDFETDGGVRWIYRQFKRDRWELSFKLQTSQLADFQALDDAVDGDATPFYFTLDVDASPIVSIYGRKNPDFAPRGTGDKIQDPVYLLNMIIIGEVPAISAYGITELWHVENAGYESVYSTPIVIENFMMGGVDQGAVAIWTSEDWYCYAKKIEDLTNDTYLWRYAAGAMCYGRAQAAILQGETNHTVFFPSHDGNIYALNADGTLRWTVANLYKREGGYGTSGLTPVAGGAAASFVQVSGKAWHLNAFIRSHSVTTYNANVQIISGTGSGATLYPILEVDPLDTSKLKFASGIFPAVDGTSRIQVVPKYESDVYFQHAGTLVVDGGVDYLVACGFDDAATKIRCSDGVVMAYYCALENNEAWPLIMDVGYGHNSVVFGSVDGYVRCLQLSDMTLEWAHLFPQGIDAALDAATIDGSTLAIIVCGRRSGDATAGRVTYLRASDGTTLYSSGDMGGDMDGRPCPVLQADGTYYVFVAGDSGKPTMLDQIAAAVWQKNNTGALYNSSPVAYDLNGDGYPELILGDMDGNVLIYNASGVLYSSLAARSGVEGIPYVGDPVGDGVVRLLIPTISAGSVKGRMTLYKFSQG